MLPGVGGLLPVVQNRVGYIIATIIGVVVTALMVNFLKSDIEEETVGDYGMESSEGEE